MIKKLILSILLTTNVFVAKAVDATWNPRSLHCLPVAVGDCGIPLIPLVHAYNTVDSRASIFHRVIPLPDNSYIIFSIQQLTHTSSKLCGGGQVQFKPQWSIARGLPNGFWGGRANQFEIGIATDCDITITGIGSEETKGFSFSNQAVCFHNPGHVSPDIMPLGFDQICTLSKVIEYDVAYSNGNGSAFAKLKSGTRQKGIILLLNDEDMQKFDRSALKKS